jgi:DNA-binding beta-propeller fold protein YncE
MKKILSILILLFAIIACSTASKNNLATNPVTTPKLVVNDTVRIANDSLEYEVIIIDNGFSTWLASTALPRNYYSLAYLENKNYLYVTEWNNRVLQPQRYSPNLYEMRIDYQPNIRYGYEVNYLIYNYMIYFQNTYKQKLGGYVPIR